METHENVTVNNVGRKTPEEIKKAMEMCTTVACTDASKCPYGDLDNCADQMTADALIYIKKLESAAAERKGGPMKNAMKFAKMLINWVIWFMAIELVVRMGWTYNDPVSVGSVWIGLVGLKCALEALTGWTK